MDLQEQLSAIGSTSDPEQSSAEPAQSEAVEGQQPAQTPEPAAPEQPDPLKEIELLKRVIATNPNMRDIYTAEKLGLPAPVQQYQPPQQPQYQPVQQQQQPEAPVLPFDMSEYDPTNAEHTLAIVGHTVSQQLGQALAPFAQFIQEQRQQTQTQQQHQAQQMFGELENQTRAAMDQHLPGFAQMAQALDNRTATPDQEMLLSYVYNKFTEEMKRNYNQAFWYEPRVQQEVIRSIAPSIKSLADRLGVSAQPAQPQPQMKPPGAYVAPSTPVPPANGSKFDEAYKKKDINAMISAIGRTT